MHFHLELCAQYILHHFALSVGPSWIKFTIFRCISSFTPRNSNWKMVLSFVVQPVRFSTSTCQTLRPEQSSPEVCSLRRSNKWPGRSWRFTFPRMRCRSFVHRILRAELPWKSDMFFVGFTVVIRFNNMSFFFSLMVVIRCTISWGVTWRIILSDHHGHHRQRPGAQPKFV